MSDVADAWRLFVALEIPAEVRAALEDATASLRSEHDDVLRFVPPASWHVTLAFLGHLEASWADAIETTLGTLAASHPSFEVGLGRAGRFGRGVLFVGFDDDAYASIRALGAEVRAALGAVGVAFDSSPLHPHLTIARPRQRERLGISRSRVAELDAAMAAAPPLRWKVGIVTLLRSHLGGGAAGDGVSYEPLARMPLRA